ncbi:Ingression protein fic1 [Ceratocystis fimbriata CBS 114723]|uniref:Ingression protein fic1 n=1 Tax=Ceratocystis fimbriata CBS 114723 TaxID=1035309 RepID=A0A2C5WVV3_9PEZI|nr:Ingression protein fic1 [Ceratocystis fimbriata CBS 114723]
MTVAKPNKPGSLSQLQHSAGIFADASIDGPEIGTLVLVVDRAKNLPNRKTIGKQDPYCAARLAKEAHKTRTDIRGGQTPRWDQELRFKVHDSPDYYQLKLSIFNDDKKTDLIGETWIDLKEIIKPGGGQNDRWQSLGCRGKYAGEIRIELTYYDNRPKPVAVPHPIGLEASLPVSDAAAGSARRNSPVKRRPLPSDPVTGEVPSHVNPSPVLRTAPSTSHMAIPPQMQDTVTQPHRVGPRPQPTTRAEQQQQAALAQKQKVLRLQKQQQELLEQQQLQQQKLQRALAEKEAAAVAAANAVAVAAVSSSPPLAQPFHHDQYGNPIRPENPPVSPHAHQDHRRASASHDQPHPLDPQYAQYREQSPSNYQGGGSVPNPGLAYGQQPPPPNRHPSYDGSVQVDDAPPPPPAHRSRGGSAPMQLQQDLGLRNGYSGASPPRPNGMRQEVLRNQTHRNPPTGSDRSSYGPGPGPSQYQGRPQSQTLSHRLSMQPTVEDVPDSPNAGSQTVIRKSIGRPSQLNPNADPRRESASAEQYQHHQSSQAAPQTHQAQQLPPAPPHQYQPSPPAHNSALPQPPVSSAHPSEPASHHQQTQHHHAAPLAPQYDVTPPPAPQHQSMQFQSHSHVQPPARPEHFQHQSSPSQAQSYQEPPPNHTQPYQANGNASHAIPPPPMQEERHEAASPYSTSPQPEPSPIEESSSMAMTLVSRPNVRKSQGPQIPASLIPGVDPIIAQEISELAHQKRQRERGFSYPTSIKTFSYHPAQGQYQQKPQGQLPAPPQYQQANSQQNQYQENSHGYPQRGRSMTTTEIVPYGYTGRGPSPNLYDDRNSSPMPYPGHDASSHRNSGREPSPNPYPSSQGQDQVGYNHRNSAISYGSVSSQHQVHHSQQMIRHGERSPSPNPYSGRGPSPNPYSGRGPSPNPYSRRGSSPNPHSGGQSPNPYSGRSPSPNPYSGRNPSPNPYTGNSASPNPRDGRSPSPNPYSRHGASPNVHSGRSPSPNPSPRPSHNTQYTIRRKSVSPAPLLSQSRRSSTVPFNPASYDEYNTNNSLVERTNVNTQDKIIMHDGREVDPSDHLPFESWAPEPDRPKDENGMQSSSPQPLGRPRPEGPSAYPGPSGRRQLKIAGHTPKSQAQIGYGGNDATQAPAPQSRNRLQKKSNRPSIGPPNQSTSPLAPVSSNYQDNFNPSRPTRAHSWDYAQENNPAYNPSGHRHGMNEPPSVPPKVSPTSGALVRVAPPRGAPPTNPDDWALMEEMQRIDIGAGRSRRHGGY